MYKKFAVIVLILAPILATFVDRVVPRHREGTAAPATAPDTPDGAVPAAPSANAVARTASKPQAFGMPTLIPQGIDPRPMLAAPTPDTASASAAVSAYAPASAPTVAGSPVPLGEATPGIARDTRTSNDDNPRNDPQ